MFNSQDEYIHFIKLGEKIEEGMISAIIRWLE